MTDMHRDGFEKWARPQGFRLDVRDAKGSARLGQYCDDTAQAAWEAWLAAMRYRDEQEKRA